METVRIRDPGWKKVGSGIRDKHPGSATLNLAIMIMYLGADLALEPLDLLYKEIILLPRLNGLFSEQRVLGLQLFQL
jgi:hypothetical protein